MKKLLFFSLVFLSLLLCYLVAVLFFLIMFRKPMSSAVVTPEPISHFTDVPTFTPSAVALAETETTASPSLATATPVVMLTATETPIPSATPTAMPISLPTATPIPPATATPILVTAEMVNVRSGPGTNYPLIGTLSPNNPAKVLGRNAPSTWWQIQLSDGQMGWVSASVVQATNVEQVAVVQAPPLPIPPTATPPAVPPTARPIYQYEPTGFYGDKNLGLTRFLGNIKDINGNAVNGAFVEAQCGSYKVISHGSGTTGWAPGFYDITLDRRPIVCKWLLTVVATEDEKNVTAKLSETIEVETTVDKSIIVANWRKNW